MAQLNEGNDEPICVVVVADGRDGANRLERLLGDSRRSGVVPHLVETVAEALLASAAGRCDAMLLQQGLGGVPLEEALRRIREAAPGMPVVAFADADGEETGDVVVRSGAADFFPVGSGNGWMLARVLKNAVERARLAARLQESERRRRAVFEHSGTAMMVVGEDGVIRSVNEPAESLLDCARQEVEERVGWAAFLKTDAERLEAVARQPRPLTPVGFEANLVRSAGDSRTVLVTVSGVPDSGDMVVSLVDMSAHGQAQSEIRKQRGFFRSLFENSPEGIVAFSVDGCVVDVNPAFERLFGFDRGGIVGKDIIKMIVPPRLEASGRQLLRDSLYGATLVRETVRRSASGAEVPVSILGAPVVLDGTQVGGFGIYRDESAQHEAQERLQEAFIDLVETISRAIESVDPYTALHQRRVARLADLVGRKLGLDDEALQGLYVGSMLHDIGKLSLPSTILTKPGKLTREEWNLVRSHSRRGFDILAEANLPWPVAEMALKHHERVDGSGYPSGVSDDGLSLELRILGVCDVVEAMTSDRPYRPALPVDAVLRELTEGSGTRYDDRVVKAVMEVVDNGEFLLNSGFRNEFSQ